MDPNDQNPTAPSGDPSTITPPQDQGVPAPDAGQEPPAAPPEPEAGEIAPPPLVVPGEDGPESSGGQEPSGGQPAV